MGFVGFITAHFLLLGKYLKPLLNHVQLKTKTFNLMNNSRFTTFLKLGHFGNTKGTSCCWNVIGCFISRSTPSSVSLKICIWLMIIVLYLGLLSVSRYTETLIWFENKYKSSNRFCSEKFIEVNLFIWLPFSIQAYSHQRLQTGVFIY